MDLREYFGDDLEALHAAVEGILKKHYVALPVQVTEDTDDGNIVKVQPTVKGHVVMPDGSKQYVDLPVMGDVPIQFSGGDNHHFTHPVKKDDEGFVVFQSRGMDIWHQSSGIQQPVDNRIGNLSDAKYVPGTHSKPKKIKNYSKKTAQMRWGDKPESKTDVSSTGILVQRNDDSLVHVVDVGVLTQKSGTSTMLTADRADHQAPNILLNC